MYFVEIKQNNRTYYLKGRLSPNRWGSLNNKWNAALTASALTTSIKLWRGKTGILALAANLHEYAANARKANTTFTAQIFKMENISNGLSGCRMVPVHPDELHREIERAGNKSNDSKTAIYKLKVNGKLVEGYNPKTKHGRIWVTAGSLRRFLAYHVRGKSDYPRGIVLEIEMADDGINVKSVKETPMLEFYFRSLNTQRNWGDSPRPEVPSTLNVNDDAFTESRMGIDSIPLGTIRKANTSY